MVTDRYLHVVHHEDEASLLAHLAEQGVTPIGVDNLPGSVPLETAQLPERCCLVFGSEGPGLTEAMVAGCERLVAITQRGSTRSMNAGAAAAIAMYQWSLQHDGLVADLRARVATMQPERFAAGLTPLPTAARVTQKRGALRWRIISTVISLAILAVIILTIGRDWPQEWTIAMVAIWVGSSAFWIVVSVFGLQRAKRDLGRIQDGVAFYLDPDGGSSSTPGAPPVHWDRRHGPEAHRGTLRRRAVRRTGGRWCRGGQGARKLRRRQPGGDRLGCPGLLARPRRIGRLSARQGALS